MLVFYSVDPAKSTQGLVLAYSSASHDINVNAMHLSKFFRIVALQHHLINRDG